MLTYEKVFEVFADYLAEDTELEIVKTRRGYLCIEWAGSSPYCDDGYLCSTPEELFDKLLADFEGFQEIKLTQGRRELTEDDHNQVRALCLPYLKIREEESK